METTDLAQQLLTSPAGIHWKNISISPHHGIVIPLFSLHSQSSCGIGEFPDLLPFLPWCKELQLDMIQLLPLNDTGIDSSPYGALSAFALNPIHLGLSQLKNATATPFLKSQIIHLQELTNTKLVNYPAVRQAKELYLRSYIETHAPYLRELPGYDHFKRSNAYWLNDYALFKAIKIQRQWELWEHWPEHLQNPTPDLKQKLLETLSSEIEYHSLLQFLCYEQFREIKLEADKYNIKIKGDIPILINRESADVWSHRHLFQLDLAAGAPPDMYSEDGQKWGFPLYLWDEMRAENYQWWTERLQSASTYYHLYRIDHIVGFFRVWAIPLDLPAKEGFFIPENCEEWIAQGEPIMRMMLQNCPMLPIGEDLGLVPLEVKDCLTSLGICGTKVMRWERNWKTDLAFIDPKEYPPISMTTVSTHDSTPLKLWWIVQSEEAKAYCLEKEWEYGDKISTEQLFAILRDSHQSNSLFHINLLLEYLSLLPNMCWENPEDERINIPGIISERNWSYRFRPSVEEIISSKELKQIFYHLLL